MTKVFRKENKFLKIPVRGVLTDVDIKADMIKNLMSNGIHSIQLGVEDYQSNDSKRPLSAARNFLAGVLLLAKAVLIKIVSSADSTLLIAARLEPTPDGLGGLTFQAATDATIDFQTIGNRLKRFGVEIDQAAMQKLQSIRNDIEHRYSNMPDAAVRESIAKAFPVVADLCRYLDITPLAALGSTWTAMIDVASVYDVELAKCKQTFSLVDWNFDALSTTERNCPSCGSGLVRQNQPKNQQLQCMDVSCQVCDGSFEATLFTAQLLDELFGTAAYEAAQGGSDFPIHSCPECSADTYLTTAEYVGCILCGKILGECGRCLCDLTPENVSGDTDTFCSYCDHVMSKDD